MKKGRLIFSLLVSFILISVMLIGLGGAVDAPLPPDYTKAELCALASVNCDGGVCDVCENCLNTAAYYSPDLGYATDLCLQDSNDDWKIYDVGYTTCCINEIGPISGGDCGKYEDGSGGDRYRCDCVLVGFSTTSCAAPQGTCEESNGGVEICDNLDNDCNDLIDEDASGTEYGLCPFGDITGTDLNTDLISALTMDSSDGSDSSTAVDVFGGNDGTVSGATFPETGVDEDAYGLDGTSEIDITEITAMPTSYSYWQLNQGENYWHNYVVSDGTTYVDGVTGPLDGDIITLDTTLKIGVGFNGLIDEVILWNRALTSPEVGELYDFYEYDTDGDGLPDDWELDNFGDLDEGADGDFDGDGYTNLEEFEEGTDPTDPNDYPGHSCTSECDSAGESDCVDDSTYKVCRDYNGDGCLEWGTNTDCDNDALCEVISGQCIKIGGTAVDVCSNYSTQEKCDGDEFSICKPELDRLLFKDSDYTTIPSGGFCDSENPLSLSSEEISPLGICNSYAEDCECAWSGTEGCYPNYNIRTECDLSGHFYEFTAKCKLKTAELKENCESTGFKTITRTAEWEVVGYDEAELLAAGITIQDLIDNGQIVGICKGGTEEYKCVSSAKLPFFNLFSFVMSSIAIIGVYLIRFNKKRD